jgi:hypothetical protein
MQGYSASGASDFTAGTVKDEYPVYAYWTQFSTTIYTSYDTSCEYMNSYADDASGSTYGDSANNRYVYPCLSKGDYIMLPDGAWGDYNEAGTPTDNVYQLDSDSVAAASHTSHMDPLNPVSVTETAAAGSVAGVSNTLDYSGHLYEIVKIWTAPFTATTATTEDRFRITVDKPIPWDGSNKIVTAVQTSKSFTPTTAMGINPIFKFDTETTSMDGNKPTYYEYVSECSNKGICNAKTALCECFKGYTKADCGTQSAFAL